ncbi:MAG: hypothetical protein ACJAVA_000823 [Flavobacteriaceae bacterium]|jgi:hypothetical protein
MIYSCVKDDDYDTPNLVVADLNLDEALVITISSLSNLLLQEQINNENDVLTFDGGTEGFGRYISGYVISNDEAGNFFEEIILQDAAENPTLGVKVLIDVNPLYITYEFGRKVFIKLDGLTVGLDSGVLSIGIREGNRIESMSQTNMESNVFRENDLMDIVAMPISISEFSADKTNLYVRLNDVQFNRNDVLGDDLLSFAGEPTDDFDGERLLESCANGSTTIFSTSTFADFKANLLPNQRGSIEGILTYNFFGDQFNVVLNDLNGINFDNPDRCDPTEVDCGLAENTGSNILFSDFFESFSDGETIFGNGWTNYKESGTQEWGAYFDDGSNASLGISAHIGSYQSGDVSTIAWLISPELNFDNQENETLNFKTSNSFSDASYLELLFSGDWDGNPDNIASATWDILTAATLVRDDDFFGDWIDSENVDLSCIIGTGYIGLKYIGSGDADTDGTYEFDEIEINF